MATVEADRAKDEQSETKGIKPKSTPATDSVRGGVDIKKLLEAGAHFGHKTSRWHPKMAQYIHSKRNGSHIIDLTHTVSHLDRALSFLEDVAADGKQILFVGTKRQAHDIIKSTAVELKMPYVVERWLGGMMTNRNTMQGRIKYLKDIESRMESGQLAAKYNKLEVQRYQEEIEEMNFIYGGIKDMAAKVGAVFIVDVVYEANAIREATKLNIPIVAIVDTNADPSLVEYPIPANDDAIKTIELIVTYVRQAVEAGKNRHAKKQPSVEEEKETSNKEKGGKD
jgi:small subunit ribosomal protein S2